MRAAAPGRVLHVGWDGWSGGTVVISHDGDGEADRYRTIYMHLLNGAEADCHRAWTETVPQLSGDVRVQYEKYLTDTGCNQNGSGVPRARWWGTNADTIPVHPGDAVERGQVIGKAGSAGPGGCGCTGGWGGPNHHLHIFFAHRDPVDGEWYFFDPYGIYGPTECYPTRDDAEGAPAATACARYPVAWLGGRPQLPDLPDPEPVFVHGDANGDAQFDIADAASILACKLLGGECPRCDDAADVNDDSAIDIADAVYALNCLFVRSCGGIGGGRCEKDTTPGDGLGCADYRACPGSL